MLQFCLGPCRCLINVASSWCAALPAQIIELSPQRSLGMTFLHHLTDSNFSWVCRQVSQQVRRFRCFFCLAGAMRGGQFEWPVAACVSCNQRCTSAAEQAAQTHLLQDCWVRPSGPKPAPAYGRQHLARRHCWPSRACSTTGQRDCVRGPIAALGSLQVSRSAA